MWNNKHSINLYVHDWFDKARHKECQVVNMVHDVHRHVGTQIYMYNDKLGII